MRREGRGALTKHIAVGYIWEGLDGWRYDSGGVDDTQKRSRLLLSRNVLQTRRKCSLRT